MNFDTLKTQSPEQLAEIAAKCGVKFHPRAKPETILKNIAADPDKIIKQIMETVLLAPQNKQPEMQHKATEQQKPVYLHSQEDIEELIAHIKAKVPQFEATYPGDGTVIFRCKGAEESCNMSIPPRIILMKAETVSRGRLVLLGLNEHFDRTAASGNSAYTNTVLAG